LRLRHLRETQRDVDAIFENVYPVRRGGYRRRQRLAAPGVRAGFRRGVRGRGVQRHEFYNRQESVGLGEGALLLVAEKVRARLEDVFVCDEAALLAIDKQYAGDLLCNTISANAGDKTDWHWPLIQIRTPPPYFCAMCCAARVSRRLLQRIAAYARVYRTLFFLEALFPTLCAGFLAQSPPELANITYRNEFSEVDRRFLYHPVKNLEKHVEFRKKCNGFIKTI